MNTATTNSDIENKIVTKMAPSKSHQSYKHLQDKFPKRYIKVLAASNQAKIVRDLIRTAPSIVLKLICNAAIHALRNTQLNLTDRDKTLLKKKRRLIEKLCDKQVSIHDKRQLLVNQRGGAFPLIPLLLTTVLSTVGPILFEKLSSALGK